MEEHTRAHTQTRTEALGEMPTNCHHTLQEEHTEAQEEATTYPKTEQQS